MEEGSYRKRLARAPFRRKEDEEMYSVPFEDWPHYKAQHPEMSSKYRTTLEELAGERHQRTLQVGDVQYRLIVWRGSVCELAVDAVQNAANGSLLGGGGVDGAIHDSAGPLITRECADRYEAVDTAGTVITKGYRLPAHYVIHTVGPVYYHDQRQAPKLLALCYQRTFELCEQHHITSLGLCCISCGIYGYPPERASFVAIEEAIKWCNAGKAYPRVIVFVTFTERETFAYRKAFAELMEGAPHLSHSVSADSEQTPQLRSQASVPASGPLREEDVEMKEAKSSPDKQLEESKQDEPSEALQGEKAESEGEKAENEVKKAEVAIETNQPEPVSEEKPKETVLSKPTQPTGDESNQPATDDSCQPAGEDFSTTP
jgi:O-acetyl-ADP-ribose deacetylase (regulator of RNase III)